MRYILIIAACLTLAGVALVAAPTPERSVAATRIAPAQSAPAANLHPVFLGAHTCASTACHGSVTPDHAAAGVNSDRIGRNEFIQWADRDPHARSLETLTGERSLAILERLRIIERKDTSSDWTIRAERRAEYKNCLKCHALDAGEVTNPLNLGALESVSCESCHGPAEKWRAAHFERTWTRALGAKSGFVDTADPSTLAAACAKCHVGAPDREVNHDLIAAGHPVLKFELAAYRDLLPKHWNDARLRTQRQRYEEQLYVAGQKQSSLAALAMTEARLARAAWPELAEYDCFACHHDLVDKSWHRPRAKGKKPGDLAEWNPWYFPADSAEMRPLREAMANGLLGTPRDVGPSIAAARRALSESPVAFDPAHAATHWDRATQAYLALAAREQSYRDEAVKARRAKSSEDDEIAKSLAELRTLLAFAPGYDSPSPAPADRRERIETLLRELHEKISARGGREE